MVGDAHPTWLKKLRFSPLILAFSPSRGEGIKWDSSGSAGVSCCFSLSATAFIIRKWQQKI